MADWLRGGRPETFTALDDINLAVEAGESVAIIGANGSGKSTLLRIVAGVTVPTTGHVCVQGRVASLLELGAGFHHALTGRENVYLNASTLGMRHKDVDRVFDDIVSFSGIGEFIDNPVDTYSSGMYVRLAFSIAIHANPDVFLVDEVLAVGDEEFQRNCRTRIAELKTQGKTLIFVSHDLGIVSALCDRCYLLSKGRMISRKTPQATIDYYLRQIGRETGIHRFKADSLEAILCHGRVSLFYEGREVSPPQGFQAQVQHMNNWYNTQSCDWVVEERRPDGCAARGHMLKLPVAFRWDMQLDQGRLTWRIAMESTQDIALDEFEVNLFLPAGYMQWTYEDLTGEFPEILSTDAAWLMVVAPEFGGVEAGALPAAEGFLPPLYVKLAFQQFPLRLRWQNTDASIGGRVLQAWGRVPASDTPMSAGVYDILTLEVDLGLTADQVRERARSFDVNRCIHTPSCSARFDNGRIHLYAGGTELTALVFLHTSVLIDQLWTDSHHLQCGDPRRVGERIEMTAESGRFPFRQHWELEPAGNDIALRVWLEALEDIDIKACHTSIGLKPDYDRWETRDASGHFPESGESPRECSPAGGAGDVFLRALSPTLPSVTLSVDTRELAFRMRALSTGARIIQALRMPKDEALHFEKGRHLYFSGTVSVGDV